MKTQEITVTIKATVPVGDYCIWDTNDEWEFDKCREFDRNFNFCDAFRVGIPYKNNFKKCPACLEACANGTERALKEKT